MSIYRKRAIAAKVEAVEGTYETLAAADGGIEIYDARFEVPQEFYERNPLRATLSPKTGLPGVAPAALTFRCELKGSGSAGTPPVWGKYLRACGFAEDINGTTDVTYAPASSAIPSLSMCLWDDGPVGRLKGARGNVRLTGRVGEPVFLEFNFEGVYQATADEAAPSITYTDADIVPMQLMGANILTVMSYNPALTEFSLDLGNTLALRRNVNAAAGAVSTLITGRSVSGTVDPEMTTVAAFDWYGKLRGGNEGTLSLVLSKAAGNITTITAPKAQFRSIGDGERDGISTRSVGFVLGMDTAGDDELSIVLT